MKDFLLSLHVARLSQVTSFVQERATVVLGKSEFGRNYLPLTNQTSVGYLLLSSSLLCKFSFEMHSHCAKKFLSLLNQSCQQDIVLSMRRIQNCSNQLL